MTSLSPLQEKLNNAPLPRIARIAVNAAAFERQQRKAGDKCLALWE